MIRQNLKAEDYRFSDGVAEQLSKALNALSVAETLEDNPAIKHTLTIQWHTIKVVTETMKKRQDGE